MSRPRAALRETAVAGVHGKCFLTARGTDTLFAQPLGRERYALAPYGRSILSNCKSAIAFGKKGHAVIVDRLVGS